MGQVPTVPSRVPLDGYRCKPARVPSLATNDPRNPYKNVLKLPWTLQTKGD